MSVCASLCQIASPSGSSMDDSSIYDSGTVSSMDSLLGPERMHPDFRIRQRLEASRQGMLQLDLLRTKHQRLMQDMRHRLSQFDDGSEVRSRPKRTVHGTIPLNTVTPSEVKLDDQRCDSPISCCVSHRSSISMDSGCISVSSDPRKLSVEERCKQLEESPTNDGHHRIVATAIESTTALRCPETKRYPRNCQRPKSMCCAAFPDESNTLLVDSRSFSQITPPPIHRNFTAVTRCESLQTRTTPYSPRNCFNARLAVVKDLPMSPVRVAVGQSPMLQTKPTLYISQEPSSPPHTRIRNPQKPSQMESCLLPKAEPQQSVFHASRVFVERSPRDICQRVESMEKVDSDEDSTHVAQPAIVVSRQQSYAQSSESCQFESREVYVVDSSDPNSFIPSQHHQLKRCESSETTMAERTRRRVTPEKEWKESEGL